MAKKATQEMKVGDKVWYDSCSSGEKEVEAVVVGFGEQHGEATVDVNIKISDAEKAGMWSSRQDRSDGVTGRWGYEDQIRAR